MLFTAFGSLLFMGVSANTHAQAVERSHSPLPTYSQQLDGFIAFCALYGVGVLLVAVQTLAPRRGLGLGRLHIWLIPVVCGVIGNITLMVAWMPA